MIVATFTVKAAREMKERIAKLVGNGTEAKLILGTFHSIARRYLLKYGHLVGVKVGWGIADSGDSLGIIKVCVEGRIVEGARVGDWWRVTDELIEDFKANEPADYGCESDPLPNILLQSS